MSKIKKYFVALLLAFLMPLSAAAGITGGAATNGLPAGAVFHFAGATCPSGSIQIPTTATTVSRSSYAQLFNAIGTTWGAGDGLLTFGLPYVGADYALVQASGNVSTATVGAVISHNHTQNAHSHGVTDPGHSHLMGGINAGSGFTGGFATGAATLLNNGIGSSVTGVSIQGATATNNATGGAANLAAGVRVLLCIKT